MAPTLIKASSNKLSVITAVPSGWPRSSVPCETVTRIIVCVCVCVCALYLMYSQSISDIC